MGDLNGAFSRRIKIQHRLIYQVLEAEKAIKMLRLWTRHKQLKSIAMQSIFVNSCALFVKNLPGIITVVNTALVSARNTQIYTF
jgi:hypothetical protein